MLFRRHGASRDLHTVSKTNLSLKSSPVTRFDTSLPPTTLEGILSQSRPLPKLPHEVNDHHPSQSQDHRTGQVPKRTPTSRKTGFATIRTDSTDSQPAFESDAFAVLMPTTRLPILDRPLPSNKTSTPAARAEAYKTYQEKARQVRERNNSQGVQVPPKLVTYRSTNTRAAQCTPMQVEISPPNSPKTPAGSFPISPPLPQTGWAEPDRTDADGSSQANGRSNICTPRKPSKATTRPTSYYRVYRTGAEGEASRSQPSSPPRITIRLKPKLVVPTEPSQTESKHEIYTSPPPNSTARPSSPTKSMMPNFTRQNSVEGDSIFGYNTREPKTTPKDTTKNEKTKPPKKDEAKPTTPKRSLASRLPWLKPSVPRASKPTPVSAPAPATQSTTPVPAQPVSVYIDPFTTYPSPSPPPPSLNPAPGLSPSPSPIKVSRPATTPSPNPRKPKLKLSTTTASPSAKFDTAFAQIQSLLLLLLKCGLVIYAVFALWFVLDALREAFNALCAPFRAMRWVSGWLGVVLVWGARRVVAMWEKWGFRVVVEGGWRGKLGW